MLKQSHSRCVRREDLHTPSPVLSDESLDEGAELGCGAGTPLIFEPRPEFDAPGLKKDRSATPEGYATTGYPFRLFAQSGRPQPDALPIIELASPCLRDGQAGFVVPQRPEGYYIWTEVPAYRKKQFEEVAVTGEDVLNKARQVWPGCAVPWRVIAGQASGSQYLVPVDNVVGKRRLGCHRQQPGKKRRISLRKKEVAARQLLETQSSMAEEKEAALRDKKARKNRAQKLRRRALKSSERSG